MKSFLIEGHAVLVDDEFEPLVKSRKWRVSDHDGYVQAITSVKGVRVCLRLHRLIAEAKPGEIVDHIDRNPLNNCRENLRIVTLALNVLNCAKRSRNATSRFKGVCKKTNDNRWVAQIQIDGRNRPLGRFKSETEAAFRYDLANIELHKEFGTRNFLPLVF